MEKKTYILIIHFILLVTIFFNPLKARAQYTRNTVQAFHKSFYCTFIRETPTNIVFRVKDGFVQRSLNKKYILSYIDSTGKRTVVNDSAVFAVLPPYNKAYKNLKPIYFNENQRLLLYDHKTKISPNTLMAICSHINDNNIQTDLAVYKQFARHRNARAAASIVTGCLAGSLAMISLASLSIGGSGGEEIAAGFAVASGAFLSCSISITIYNACKIKKSKKILYAILPVNYNRYVHQQKENIMP